jgi:outer membrane receptor for ferrienterochelin and colicin
MQQRRRKCRGGRISALLAAAFVAITAAGHAQATGKVDGRISDPQGQPIANATVTIVGTAYAARSNPQGYYFFNNVPAGVVSIRAAFVGFKPKEVTGLRVLSGQTITQDFVLEQSAVALRDIEVVAAQNALVPRDQVTTRQSITGDFADKLPADRLSALFALQPGVTGGVTCPPDQPQARCTNNFSVRGSRVDEQTTYVDGVPVQPGIRVVNQNGAAVGVAPNLDVAVNAVEDAAVTTGASSAEFGNAQGGVINITTRAGGSRFAGNFSVETSALAPAHDRSGFNMLQGSFGGPLVKDLTFFLSGRLEGINAANNGYRGWELPTFTAVGVDTTYRLARQFGNARSDSVDVNVYDYAVTSGDCRSFDFVRNAADPGMRSNYGASCTSNETWAAPNTTMYGSAKLNYSFGGGSRLALSYLSNGNQFRNRRTDGFTAGQASRSNVATLNWTQVLSKKASRAVSLDSYLSYQWNHVTTANLTPASEAASRDPFLGFLVKPLQFMYDAKDFPVDSTLIYNVLLNRANRRIGTIDKLNTSQYAGQAGYGVATPDPCGCGGAGGGGASDQGVLAYNIENRLVGKSNLDWQVDRYNRLKVGAEYTHYDITDYSGSVNGTNTFHVKPVRYNAFVEDRLDLGDVVLVGGLRYDYYHSNAWRWRDYPRVSTRPGFVAPTFDANGNATDPGNLFCPKAADASVGAWQALHDSLAAAGSACSLMFDPAHNYLSPHVQVSFPVTEKTNFRLSYAQQVQAPDFGLVLRNATSDIDVGGVNSRTTFGQDLDFGKTILFEFGARHAFSDDMVLDVAVYNKDNVANPAVKYAFPVDPLNGAATRHYFAQNTDFGNTRGLDVRLDRRIGNYFNGSVSYSFQDSKNTGSDPFSYLGFFEAIVSADAQPPLAALPTNTSRPHSLTGQFNVQLPADWAAGSVLGAILHRTGVFGTFRLASGAPYTRCLAADGSSTGVLSGGTCGNLGAVSGYNGARLPMFKQFDLRVNRDFNIGKLALTGYVDARNLLNLQNVTSVWSTTGTTANGQQAENLWVNDSVTFRTFGQQSGTLAADGVSLNLPTTKAGCAGFHNGSTPSAPTCFYYQQSEKRFGNGDGVYTAAEQRRASDLKNYYNTFHISNFVSGTRTVRVGFEVNF